MIKKVQAYKTSDDRIFDTEKKATIHEAKITLVSLISKEVANPEKVVDLLLEKAANVNAVLSDYIAACNHIDAP